jgi:hypothetical protein
MSKAVMRILKTKVGIVGTNPRIFNVDTKRFSYGYAEVNINASSPFSRTKVHKGWLEGGSDIVEGSLIQDRLDSNYYMVMSVKKEGWKGEVAYKDVTLYYCNKTCTIQRFSEAKATNAFGRVVDSAPATLHTNVYIMVNPQNYDEQPGKDIILENNKIKLAIQSKYGVQVNDRIVTSEGDTLIVETVDKYSLVGIWILGVDKDSR